MLPFNVAHRGHATPTYRRFAELHSCFSLSLPMLRVICRLLFAGRLPSNHPVERCSDYTLLLGMGKDALTLGMFRVKPVVSMPLVRCQKAHKRRVSYGTD